MPAESGAGFRTAALGAGTGVVMLVVWLGYDLLRPGASSCEAIFQQTEQQLSLKLDALDTGLVLGRQQVQALGEKAQLTAVTLKSCCVMQELGALPDGFAECRGASTQFEEKLDALAGHIEAVAAARDAGDAAAEQAAREASKRLVEDATRAADHLQRRVESLPRPPLERAGQTFFHDDFEGDALGPVWEIRQRDDDRWALEGADSSLQIVTQAGSIWGGRDDLRNQFLLAQTTPDEDFVIETTVRIAIENQENGASLGIVRDADNFLQIGYRGFPHGYNVRRSPFFLKEIRGEQNYSEVDLTQHGGVREPETVHLRIERSGNKFTGFYALGEGSADEVEWRQITTHTLPNFSGRPALWADNNDGDVYTTGNRVSPEVLAEFAHLTIRPGDS